MKTTIKQFELFKRECEYWIEKFELSSFEFRFNWCDITAKAQVHLDQVYDGVYSIDFSKNIDGELNNDYIKRIAKHEMIHCLIGEFSECGYRRFVDKNEFDKLEEKITNKLEKLIIV